MTKTLGKAIPGFDSQLAARKLLLAVALGSVGLLTAGCGGGGGGSDSGNTVDSSAIDEARRRPRPTPIPPPPTTNTLTVTTAGSGMLTSSPAGISCGGTCSSAYTTGTAVVLTATPSSGAAISSWGGACAATPASQTQCTVTMSANLAASVSFSTSSMVNVTMGPTASGSDLVTGTDGISCGAGNNGTCSALVTDGHMVTLAANPDSTKVFMNWTNGTGNATACTNSSAPTCTFTLSNASSVQANFGFANSVSGTLKVSVAGGGTVRNTVGGPGVINCDSNVTAYSGACNQPFASGSSVTLTASPSAGYSFAGWFSPDAALLPNSSTGCSGTASSCTFTKTSTTQYLTAIFAPTGSAQVTQVYSDIASGPTTGGEAGKGIYLSIFGKGFGSTGAGTTAKMYLNNIEVANYKYIGASRGRTDIQQLSAQVGSLGGVANGKLLPIKVVINGRLASDPNHLTFMTNPGKIYFASLAGNDTTGVADDITKPFRTVQKSTINNNGSAGCPVAPSIQSVSTAGVWGLMRPGDFLIMRAGNWTDVSKDNFFLRAQNKSGSAPTGSTDTGPITLMGYPGEYVMIDRTNTVNRASGGGISSADSARQALGCGAWITLANLRIESGFNDGPITTQAGATNPNGSHWRVVNNEMTAISCQYNDNCKGAGVSGSGLGGYWAGNHVHDIYDMPGNGTDLENHGFYMDGVGSYEVAYNRIENIYGGNGVQTYSTTTSTTTNAHIHHNIIKNTGKHGINLSDGTATGIVIHDNVVYDTARASLRFNTVNLSGAKVYNNTFYKARVGGALMNNWNLPTGAVDFRNNIVVPLGTAYVSEGGSGLTNGSNTVASNNLWYSGTGSVIGSSNVANDPSFVSTTDLHLQPTSPARDMGTSAVSATVTDDNDSIGRPSGGLYDIGAYELPQ